MSHDQITIAKGFNSVAVLENNQFRPYTEVTLGTSDIGSPLVKAEVTVTEFKSESMTVDVNIDKNVKVDRNENYYLTLKENYFIAWTATVDGKKAEVQPTENGLICVKIDKNHFCINVLTNKLK